LLLVQAALAVPPAEQMERKATLAHLQAQSQSVPQQVVEVPLVLLQLRVAVVAVALMQAAMLPQAPVAQEVVCRRKAVAVLALLGDIRATSFIMALGGLVAPL
jgi:hypothetical protein